MYQCSHTHIRVYERLILGNASTLGTVVIPYEGSDMPNRAERRATAKRNKQNKGVPQQYDETKGRNRGGMIDEYALQERSRRLEEHELDGEWKPSSSVQQATSEAEDINLSNPNISGSPHSVRQVFRIITWTLIVLCAVAFLVIMWIPSVPMWLIITIAAVFGVSVISLFFVAGNSKDNPNLDANGCAI